jgi:hypothetical protein
MLKLKSVPQDIIGFVQQKSSLRQGSDVLQAYATFLAAVRNYDARTIYVLFDCSTAIHVLCCVSSFVIVYHLLQFSFELIA